MDPTTDRTLDPTNDLTTDPTEVPTDALTVAEAAEVLGITTEAARMRVKRGTLPSTRIGGTVYVLMDRPNLEPNGPNGPNAGPNDQSDSRPNGAVGGTTSRTNGRPNGHPDGAGALLAAKDETIEELRDRVEQLTRILETRDEDIRRRDTILMQMAQRIPELPSSSYQEPRGDLGTIAQSPGGVEASAVDRGTETNTHHRSWWRRLIGD